MISVIEGILYHDNINDTRSYCWLQENLIEFVISRKDEEFLRQHDKLALPGIYILVGFPNYNSATKVYVGQTTDIRRRFRQHMKKKDFWEFGIALMRNSGHFSTFEIEYLEHLLIKTMLEHGNVQLLENSQIPKVYLDETNKREIEKIFERIKNLLAYSGFDFFSKRKQIELEEFCVEEPGESYGKKIRDSLKTHAVTNNRKEQNVLRFYDDYYEEENETETFEVITKEYAANVISLKDGRYMLLPFGRVKKRNKWDFPESWLERIDVNSGNIVKDIVTDDLRELSRFVSDQKEKNIFIN